MITAMHLHAVNMARPRCKKKLAVFVFDNDLRYRSWLRNYEESRMGRGVMIVVFREEDQTERYMTLMRLAYTVNG